MAGNRCLQKLRCLFFKRLSCLKKVQVKKEHKGPAEMVWSIFTSISYSHLSFLIVLSSTWAEWYWDLPSYSPGISFSQNKEPPLNCKCHAFLNVSALFHQTYWSVCSVLFINISPEIFSFPSLWFQFWVGNWNVSISQTCPVQPPQYFRLGYYFFMHIHSDPAVRRKHKLLTSLAFTHLFSDLNPWLHIFSQI